MGIRCSSGCCKKKEMVQDPSKRTSNNVEMDLLQQELNRLFNFKILLLGAGESGKSTIVKQLKRIHKKEITQQELDLVAISLHQNLVDCLKALFYATKAFGTHTLSPKGQELEQKLYNWNENTPLTPEMGVLITEVWEDDGAIQNTFKRRSEFWLLDSFEYYIEHVERFCKVPFTPIEDDCVMARIRTTGIVETNLEQKIVAKNEDEPDVLKFQIVDVGGQRNERKKWLHCFDDVKAILFCVNLAGYNQVLFEDTRKNRMHEALELFQKVSNNSLFEDTPIFLFLNKKDLFESMVLEYDMNVTFPKYTGGKELFPAMDFIKDEFRSQMPPKKQPKKVQEVSARVKREIKYAFEDVKKTLYDENRSELIRQARRLKKDMANLEKEQNPPGCCPSNCCPW